MLNKVQALLSYIETYVSKRKLIAIFGAIVIIAVLFLYYENFYSTTTRAHLNSQMVQTTNKISHENEEPEELLKNKFEKEKELINDNKNNGNVTKCWNIEKYTVIDQCFKCDSFSMNFLLACKETGYREVLKCEKYGHVSRSCPVPKHVIIKRYWSFELISICMAIVFTSIVFNRKRFLDNIAYERVRRQLLS